MSKYFIGGSAGTGKTSIVAELVSRGYNAYDADAFSRLEDKEGNPISTNSSQGPTDWSLVSWNWSKKDISKILETDEDVFLAGNSTNMSDYFSSFDKIFVLYIKDPGVHAKRIMSDKNERYGKNPGDLKKILLYRDELVDKLLSQPVSMKIDAGKAVKQVVDDILVAIRGDQ